MTTKLGRKHNVSGHPNHLLKIRKRSKSTSSKEGEKRKSLKGSTGIETRFGPAFKLPWHPRQEKERRRLKRREWSRYRRDIYSPENTSRTFPSCFVCSTEDLTELREVIEVPEDSPDAKKWPLYREDEAQIGCRRSPSAQRDAPSTTTPPLPATTETDPAPTPKPPLKKPGPRKPKTVLSAVPSSSSQKAKKLTTLDKSVMDWKAHIQDTTLQEELEANRKGGGYLEKVEFLKRVEDRKEENLEAMKSRKRRKL